MIVPNLLKKTTAAQKKKTNPNALTTRFPKKEIMKTAGIHH